VDCMRSKEFMALYRKCTVPKLSLPVFSTNPEWLPLFPCRESNGSFLDNRSFFESWKRQTIRFGWVWKMNHQWKMTQSIKEYYVFGNCVCIDRASRLEQKSWDGQKEAFRKLERTKDSHLAGSGKWTCPKGGINKGNDTEMRLFFVGLFWIFFYWTRIHLVWKKVLIFGSVQWLFSYTRVFDW